MHDWTTSGNIPQPREPEHKQKQMDHARCRCVHLSFALRLHIRLYQSLVFRLSPSRLRVCWWQTGRLYASSAVVLTKFMHTYCWKESGSANADMSVLTWKLHKRWAVKHDFRIKQSPMLPTDLHHCDNRSYMSLNMGGLA